MSPITEFYSERTLLVTGGTGFMGKVLLEKLVRSLPDLKRIYVLLRPKRGITPARRLEEILSKPPFTLQNIDPKCFEKIVALQGDTTLEDLGLTAEMRLMLINEVSVVFHLAASIRMNLSLKEAVLQNTYATQSVLNLCVQMKNLVSVVYLSTAFCNIDVQKMDERIYEPNIDTYQVIDLVKWLDEESLERIRINIMGPHPNTYTFSKRLAEVVAYDIGKKIPVVICRPSIVIPSFSEPCPGWVDNFNGAVGLLSAGGKGIIRSALADPESIPQVIPVDIAINALIACGWNRAINEFYETPVYNITQGDIVRLSWSEILYKFKNLVFEYPYKRFLWYPVAEPTTNWWLHYLIVVVFHMIPAYLIDFLLVVFRQKPFLVKVQKKLNTGMVLLSYFATRTWTFSNKRSMALTEQLSSKDKKTFYILEDIDVDKYIRDVFFGSRKYCFNEDCENLTVQRIILKIMYVLEYIARGMLLYGIVRLMLHLIGLSYILSWNNWTTTIDHIN